MSTRRPILRAKDLERALTCAKASGLEVRAARVFPDGGFALQFSDGQPVTVLSDLDMELIRLEAKYGEG